ncbi:MAG TPA: response regulator transcription factor [Pseudolysinimonas sp.]|jgi:DNA-binding NarL/FixJ family response regulator|nr:response regulator transcription factor [Pseudolysinimonas sp.]
MSDAVTVLVVDDQSIVRAGLRTMLDAEPDITVVGEARNGREAIAEAARHRPDVVLMDVRMPELDGVQATRAILDAGTAGAVLIITTFDDEEYLLGSVRAGASGFVLKDAGPDLLAAAVRAATRGDSLIDPAMTRALLQHRLSTAAGPGSAGTSDEPGDALAAVIASLSGREREVLAALARGLSNAEVAAELFVSDATVKTHISNVLLKTGARSRVQAAVFAYESGFVRPGWLGGE